ncbi:hypothetical protein Plhal703r1_c32g0123501 [Plasmopara halstedii]
MVAVGKHLGRARNNVIARSDELEEVTLIRDHYLRQKEKVDTIFWKYIEQYKAAAHAVNKIHNDFEFYNYKAFIAQNDIDSRIMMRDGLLAELKKIEQPTNAINDAENMEKLQAFHVRSSTLQNKVNNAEEAVRKAEKTGKEARKLAGDYAKLFQEAVQQRQYYSVLARVFEPSAIEASSSLDFYNREIQRVEIALLNAQASHNDRVAEARLADEELKVAEDGKTT